MYKLLIVDDEKNIRLGIQAMIKRQFESKVEVETAMDGLEAIEKIKDVDILITDIKMPRMDGIQLIEHIQQSDQKAPAMVILSGYDDFEFTKAAIKNKVKDYLLKPVNRNELYHTLTNILEELEKNNQVTYQHLEEYRTSQLNFILLNPNIQPGVIEYLIQKMQLPPFENGYYVGIFDHKREMDGEDLLIRIKPFIAQCNIESDYQTICFIDSNDRVVVISEESIFKRIKDHLKKEKYITFSTGVSKHHRHIRDFKEAYNEADYALKYHFLFPRNQLFSFQAAEYKPESMEIPIDLIKKIANMLGTERDKELKSTLLKVLDYEKISGSPIEYMESLNQSLNQLVFECFFSKLGDESVEIFKMLNKVENMYNFDNFNEYFQAVEDLLMRLHEYNKQIKLVYSEQKYLEQAVCFIKENYYKDLNLAVVSNHISLNYSYFSHMFKEYTGQNFVDYLKKIRIEEAKILLRQPEYKVFEVSEMVGYKNPKQFTRVFREIEGISPTEYREHV
ncbi:response regulator [Neobacillus sp. D3-1R]|uniref:response regulator n=1 Tax=Neobacillus sp. D3-1R TaxID=3445778 RepID=UPI003FA0C1BE